MSKKTIKKTEKPLVVKLQEVKAVKTPKFKLISYTIKAIIPTGQYANICPEITVQAETIEQAERAVMPYIETFMAKYRDGGVREVTGVPAVRPVASVPVVPVAPKTFVAPTPAPVAPVPSPIVLTVPFNRAKSAIDSCTSIEALKLVSDQVEKSTKLIDVEKVELKKMVTAKFEQLNGPKTV